MCAWRKQVYFYGMCQNPTGSNYTFLCENVTRITTGKETHWLEPCNFSILSLKANFPSAAHKLFSLQSGQYEKGGTQHLMDTTPPHPKTQKDWCCNVMSVSNVSAHKGGWMLKLPTLSKHAPGHYSCSVLLSNVSPGAELCTLNSLESSFPFFLDSCSQCGLIQKHARQRSLQSKVLQLELSTKILTPLQPLGTSIEGGWEAEPLEPHSLLDAGTTQDGISK